MIKSGIYQILCLSNSKVYIGRAYDLSRRKNRHFYDLRKGNHRNSHLQNTFNKYGEESFIFEAIEECSKEILENREQFYLDTIPREKQFNIATISKAPFHGRKHSENSKKRMIGFLGRHHSIETKERLSTLHKGIKHGKDFQEKMSSIVKGRKFTETHKRNLGNSRKKRVVQIDLQTKEIVKIFDSAIDAQYITGINHRQISRVCTQAPKIIKGKKYFSKSAGGYGWQFLDLGVDLGQSE